MRRFFAIVSANAFALAIVFSSSLQVLAQAPMRLLSEDFESTETGQIPTGYTKNGDVAVVDDVAHTGKKSLRLGQAERGPRRIVKRGEEVAAFGGTFWGRLYFKVQLPAPKIEVVPGQRAGVIHSTIAGGTGVSPLHKDRIEVRVVDTVMRSDGLHQFLYNVQPLGTNEQRRSEFATGGKYTFRYTDQWTLAEWFVDHSTQSYRFFVNGDEVTEITINKGAGEFRRVELPENFESFYFGWNNYQPASPGFVAWIDDIVVAKERIGGTDAQANTPK